MIINVSIISKYIKYNDFKIHMKSTKYFIAGTFATLIRLIRLFPNNDPIMSSTLPFARQDKWWKSFIYVISVMFIFDIITNKIGLWTIVTSLTYGMLILFSSLYLKNTKISLFKYISTSAIIVLIYDLITGPIMSHFIFNMTLLESLIGQIPFTLYHLASGIGYTLLFAPVLDHEINQNFNIVKITRLEKINLKV
jgi:hypothetical protein